jgi:pheromone a factor receptor
MVTSNHVFSALSFLSFSLLLFPLYWRIRGLHVRRPCFEHKIDRYRVEPSRYVAVVAFIAWTALGCINLCINSILWDKTAVDKVPIWCEICTATHLPHIS